ncbi:MAG: esterase-like activity of phytase family protein, partial [Phreatobacter sp.]
MRALVLAAAVFAVSPAFAQQEFPATLAGHAVLPAATFIQPPADAPADLQTPGKFTGAARNDAVGSVMGLSAGRPTGLSVPFRGQPAQGHSGIKRMADGTFWVITDNGFGAKANSPDSMLYLNRYRIDWDKGSFECLQTIFLSDPDKKVPFRIANEATERRYLTGSDFDLESFQIVGDKIWIGDEFGPYLIRIDMTGKVEAVFDTLVDGQVVRSPDNPAVTTPAVPGGPVNFRVRRSKGFEGMAASPDGRFLYPLLEGALWDTQTNALEMLDGKQYLRILEFDVQAGRYTGRHWKFVLDENNLSIGDFNMIDATTGMIIVRDDNEGVPERACPQGQRAENCFHALPRIKRIWKIEMTDANAGGAVRKIGFIDLLRIQDPNKRSRVPLS